MSTPLADAVIEGRSGEELLSLPLPGHMKAVTIHKDQTGMFDGVADKDVRKSMHVEEVPMPELAPDEVLVAVMAGAINFNTVWSATFEPVPTFRFLEQMGRRGGWDARHDLPYHILGSDASGVVVRTGSAVRRWNAGDHVVIGTAYVDEQDPATHRDGMLGEDQRAWGFETNFGGLAEYTVVRASQLLPKPALLTWEEAASNPLCAGTAYRMLVSDRGARMKQGDVVLIWGATGGLGAYAVQLVRNGGGIPVGVVSSAEKAEVLRKLGCEAVIDRSAIEQGDRTMLQRPEGWKKLGKAIRDAVGEDPHIVFEHVGKATFAASVFLARRGGTVVTCGSSTGYDHQYDNRYLWMKLKNIIGSHGANLDEQWETNRLIGMGKVLPALSATYALDDAGEAARSVQVNEHLGKVGVLGLAPRAGLGVTDAQARARVGEERFRLFQS
ncbi:crotonyl-CoA carboxylase/reductase [Streptomyces sp. 3211.6]|uniref:crotonyl-CoA carboxylase/reductase n=1 Tax=Streptomyces TaxID=1883 RepID=UPI0009A4818E|nr:MULTISPECIES: crotonyl-CoA carboxylase/reductase [Streptomyces]RKT07841.1 crotonyl-CoA carboxylase/reductase [Streptomyces sp. 3211.6]RPF44535.1 crotonyl-CoA carboxylase/reductase [Streptomyces sp. Ag109_G2-6]